MATEKEITRGLREMLKNERESYAKLITDVRNLLMAKNDLERKLDWELQLVRLLNNEKSEISRRMKEYRDDVLRATSEKEKYRKAMTD